MKQQAIYQVDAFASALFTGNPAAVCPLSHWLSDELMQLIARENNLSETAFIVPEDESYQIRWFTPNTEVALCGHATLASAYIVFEFLNHQSDEVVFNSQSGPLLIKKCPNQRLQMNFPTLPFTKITPPPELLSAMNIQPMEVYESTFDLLCIFRDEQDVQNVQLNLNAIAELNHRGVILSAPAKKTDIYSRCFYPRCAVPEDPVTGSAHCVLAPFWSERLGKKTIHAQQGLKRQGELWCEVHSDRVLLYGHCQLYLQGHISLP